MMTTTRRMPASTASTIAPLAKAGGTKITETAASVALLASATVPWTGISTAPALTPSGSAPGPRGVTSKATAVPALRGLTPATTLVPAHSMRRVNYQIGRASCRERV